MLKAKLNATLSIKSTSPVFGKIAKDAAKPGANSTKSEDNPIVINSIIANTFITFYISIFLNTLYFHPKQFFPLFLYHCSLLPRYHSTAKKTTTLLAKLQPPK